MSHTSSGPEWVLDEVFYQIFPDRFARSDREDGNTDLMAWGRAPSVEGFFGGDLTGIEQHLDYLDDLGITSLYLTPIFTATTNHRYDTVDYFSIDSRLGDKHSFDSLVQSLHKCGKHIILDAVFNHCSNESYQFQDVVEHQGSSPFVNWFYVNDFPVVSTPEPNYLTFEGVANLPKLNSYNPEVRDYLCKVGQYWIQQGIDGWRLDVPYLVENDSFWEIFREKIKGMNSDAYIVAEVWEEARDWAGKGKSDGAMNYRWRDATLEWVTDWRVTGKDYALRLKKIEEEIGVENKAFMLNLLGSHDTERLITHVGGDYDVAKLCFGLLMTAEGIPMIYYGDEIGIPGFNDPGCRACMPWNEERPAGLGAESPVSDLHRWIKELIQVRKNHIALRRGEEHTIYSSNDIIAQLRSHPDEKILIVANRSESLRHIALGQSYAKDLLTGENVDLSHIGVPAKYVRILQYT
ncbi:glycoside hydrolase family 13 protein [Arcanobacterium phocae]|uniref:glycoside hydrolase family 13 protein n=1 Tax=Arcanobacterium phocae TaxID=131112 RepID=UPI001C0E9BBF|nr:glycoside hydrolase family 13 protein [Arcanobacterium phocae]